MGIGSTNTARMREWLAKHGRDYNGPEISELLDLATRGPSFVVIDGQLQGEAMGTLSQIHDLYRKEGVRMEAAFHPKEKAYLEKKAYSLANPPVPQDVTIQFWDRASPRR